MNRDKNNTPPHSSDLYTVFKQYLSVVRAEFRRDQETAATETLAYKTAMEYARQHHLADGEIILQAMQLQAEHKNQDCVDLLSAHLAQMHPLISSYAWNTYSVALWQLQRFDESAAAFTQTDDDDEADAPKPAAPSTSAPLIPPGIDQSATGKFWFSKGYSLSEQGNHVEAADAYRKALEDIHYPVPGRIWNNLGNTLSDLGETDEAIAAYRKAVVDPGYITPQHAWTNLGNLYSKSARYGDAINAYHKALETSNDKAVGRTWFNIGLTLSEQGRNDEAIDAHTRALEDPAFETPSYAWFNIGLALTEQGKPDAAIAAYHEALSDPNYDTPGFSWNNIGTLLSEQEKHDDAADAYRKALEDPQFDAPGDAWFNIAYSLSEQGRHAEAIDAYRSALASPDGARGDAWNNLGYAYSKLGRHDDAIAAYHQALSEPNYDTRGYTWNNLGLALSKQGKYDEVIDAYEKALAEPNYDAPGDAWFNIGSEYYREGNIPKAREAFDKALRLYHPDSPEYNDARHWYEMVQALKKPEPKDSPQLDKPKKSEDDATNIEWRIRSELESTEQSSHEDYQQQSGSGRDNVISVLRGWNNTTSLPEGAGVMWNGGGYLIKWRGKGIVIDPGSDFVRNLHRAGFHAREIDAVLVSHNNSEHNGDLRKLDDLRYELYKRRRSDEQSEIKPYVLIWDGDSKANVQLATQKPEHLHYPIVFDPGRCRPEDTIVKPYNLPFSVTYFGVHHDNTFDAFGFKVRLHGDNGSEFVIGYTGDTEYFPELAERLAGCDLLISHINQPDTKELDDPNARKKGHLGYRGLAELIKHAQPKLTLVGDFWAGLVDLRIDLVEGLRRLSGTPDILPIGYGLNIDLPQMTIFCNDCGTAVPYTEVSVAPPLRPFGELRYLCANCAHHQTKNAN